MFETVVVSGAAGERQCVSRTRNWTAFSMAIEVNEDPVTVVAEYADIPIAFEVSEIFDVAAEPDGSGRFALHARHLPFPYVKDYDAIAGEGPAQWAQRFDVSKWGCCTARSSPRDSPTTRRSFVCRATLGLHLRCITALTRESAA